MEDLVVSHVQITIITTQVNSVDIEMGIADAICAPFAAFITLLHHDYLTIIRYSAAGGHILISTMLGFLTHTASAQELLPTSQSE